MHFKDSFSLLGMFVVSYEAEASVIADPQSLIKVLLQDIQQRQTTKLRVSPLCQDERRCHWDRLITPTDSGNRNKFADLGLKFLSLSRFPLDSSPTRNQHKPLLLNWNHVTHLGRMKTIIVTDNCLCKDLPVLPPCLFVCYSSCNNCKPCCRWMNKSNISVKGRMESPEGAPAYLKTEIN